MSCQEDIFYLHTISTDNIIIFENDSPYSARTTRVGKKGDETIKPRKIYHFSYFNVVYIRVRE